MRSTFFALLIAPIGIAAQSLVDQEPHNRTALLEEFTGIKNGDAPAAHAISEQIQQWHPGEVAVVRIHAGFFAVPDDGQPDFRTSWSEDLFAHFAVPFTPTGVIGRSPLFGSMVQSLDNWSLATDVVLFQASPVNLGVASAFEPNTRELTVTIELYYTADADTTSDFIHVLLTEDHIIGYQNDANATPPDVLDYDHRHVLRAYITDLWGDEVTTTLTGSSVIRTYTFTVPDEFDIANCNVVAFVGNYQGAVHQVKEVAADGGTTEVGIDEADGSIQLAPAYPQPASERVFIPVPVSMQRSALEIRDGQGRLVASKRTTDAIHTFDVSAWPAGVYVYQFIGSEAIVSGRLCVAH